MMHHPNMHHQQMGGPHGPQHIQTQGIPSHQQYQPQMPRENRIPMSHNQQGGGMPMNGVHRIPPHSMPLHHHHAPHQHHMPQVRSIRRSYNNYGGGSGTQYGHRPSQSAPLHTSHSQHTPVVSALRTLQPIPHTIQPSAKLKEAVLDEEEDKTVSDTSPANDNVVANNKEKTSMCLVNELARYNKIKHQYRLTSETGPAHKKVFTVTLRLGEDEEYTAEGSSIKRAQHAAAAAALAASRLPAPPPRAPHLPSHHRHHAGAVMPTVELNALAMKLCSPAVYSAETPLPAPYPPYPQRVVHRVRVMVCGRTWTGEGTTPQAARHDAAARALRDLRREQNQTQTPALTTATTNEEGKEASSEAKSPVSMVHELALKRNLSVVFAVKSERGPPHMRVFVTTCTVGELVTDGEGNGKKISKKRAAEAMMEEMKRRWPGAISRQSRRRPIPTKRKPRNLIKENVENGASADASDNPVSALAAARTAARAREPVYRLLDERGAARRREFLVQCEAPPHCARALGPNKKEAKRRAAKAVLVLMGLLPPDASAEEHGVEYITKTSANETPDSRKENETVKKESPEKQAEGTNSTGRQIVPGVLIMQDSNKSNANIIANCKNGTEESATVINTKSTLGAKDQLMYLSKLLSFTVQFSDFPKRNHGSYLTLVSLSTRPPVMAHGAGDSTEASHEVCARNALNALAAMGLDTTSTNERAASPKSVVISNGQT